MPSAPSVRSIRACGDCVVNWKKPCGRNCGWYRADRTAWTRHAREHEGTPATNPIQTVLRQKCCTALAKVAQPISVYRPNSDLGLPQKRHIPPLTSAVGQINKSDSGGAMYWLGI